MNSLILSTATRVVQPILLIVSLFILFRGHNEPGGGFIGGLVAAAGVALLAFAEDVVGARKALRIDPRHLVGVGLLIALGSGLWAPILGQMRGIPLNFLEGVWEPSKQPLPIIGKLGTPLVFDIGVYLVVIGVVTLIVFTMFEEGAIIETTDDATIDSAAPPAATEGDLP